MLKLALVTVLAGALCVGCAPPLLEVRPLRTQLEVRLDPAAHTLEARSSTDLAPGSGAGARDAGRKMRIDIRLNPEITIDTLETRGLTVVGRKTRKGKNSPEKMEPTIHRLIVRGASDRPGIDMRYHGNLNQDIAAGEKDEEVHNFAVSAHVGGEGIFLEPSGYWYPQFRLPDGTPANDGLQEFELEVAAVAGFELVAGLEATGDGRWASPHPLDGLVLLGGPLDRYSRVHDGIALHTVLAKGKAEVADDILDTSAEYLDRYRPLIGPYPFSEFTVLEAFFSSGFAFPACTQIAGSQLSEYKQYRRHGYLDHELLHNWYGNGILVDPDDGNWCEGLASYLGNYYGHVLDGDEEGARKQRRNQSNFLSSIGDEDDKPLGTFGLEDGAGRGIGYSKGAAVFHMLERKLGADAFFAGLRLLNEEQTGRHIGWEIIREAMERAAGTDLTGFFGDWVRSPGAPQLAILNADRSPDGLRLELSQGKTEFELDVPLRLHYAERQEDLVVRMDRGMQRIELDCETSGLAALELDPDYQLFRKLKPEEVMPTSALTRDGERLLIVLPDVDEAEIAEGYRTVQASFRRAVLGEDDDRQRGHEVIELRAAEITPDDLLGTSVLILGQAVHSPVLVAFLSGTRSPAHFDEGGFAVGDRRYAEAGQAIYFTVQHPEDHELGVTVYYGNSAEALSNARVLNFYPNSLLVFETPAGAETEDPSGMPRAKVLQREDFEFHERWEF